MKPTYDQLQDRIEELEELLGTDDDQLSKTKSRLGVSPLTAKTIGYMSRREFTTRNSLWIALYGMVNDNEQPEEKALDQWIFRARRALRPHGITIKNDFGRGWKISPEDRAKVHELIAA